MSDMSDPTAEPVELSHDRWALISLALAKMERNADDEAEAVVTDVLDELMDQVTITHIDLMEVNRQIGDEIDEVPLDE